MSEGGTNMAGTNTAGANMAGTNMADSDMAGTGASDGNVLLGVRDLKKHFPIKKGFLRRVAGHIRAVDGVSFDLYEKETLGLVGESGCGKTTVAKMIVRAIDPTDGQMHFAGESGTVDVAALRGEDLLKARRSIQMIFQDPYASLNPRHRIRDIIGEPLLVNRMASGKQLEERVAALMEQVGLRPEYAIRYPHAFSGGQRQRIGIARALSLSPRLIVCDEPVSALDMSIQAQILNLLKDLQDSYGLTYLVISHDLGVVQHISDRVAVMYLGKLVEVAPTEQLFSRPRHPYTEALLSASPKPHPRYRGQMKVIAGEVPDATQRIEGCPFRTRCPYAQDICAEQEPELAPIGTEPDQLAACHFASELSLTGATTAGNRA
jgi:peptide/nickel transport system ATP-binding protein